MDLSVSGIAISRTLSARLADLDDSSRGIAGREVAFFAEGLRLGESTTDADGFARFTPPPPYWAGPQHYEARFSGDDYYRASSAVAKS